jgi:hypothetical protein
VIENMAGETGLEPAASGVTGRAPAKFLSKLNIALNGDMQLTGCKLPENCMDVPRGTGMRRLNAVRTKPVGSPLVSPRTAALPRMRSAPQNESCARAESWRGYLKTRMARTGRGTVGWGRPTGRRSASQNRGRGGPDPHGGIYTGGRNTKGDRDQGLSEHLRADEA